MLKRALLTALAVTAGVLATVSVATPAQAAPPDEINHDQVNQTTNRRTERPPANLEGTEIELRSGYYGGYQYGWVRLKPGTRYRDHDGLVLQWRSGGSGWRDGPSTLIQPGGPTFTGGKLTYAAQDYNFRACIFRGRNYACTEPPW